MTARLEPSPPTFGDLRQLCEERPNEYAYRAICRCINRAHLSPALRQDVLQTWLPYAIRKLEGWPHAMRLAHYRDLRDVQAGERRPALQLARALNIDRFSYKWDLQPLLNCPDLQCIHWLDLPNASDRGKRFLATRPELFTQIEELTIRYGSLDPEQIPGFIETLARGESLRSIVFNGLGLVPWMRALRDHDQSIPLRSLKLSSCRDMSPAELQALSHSALVEDLESLDFNFVSMDSEPLIGFLKACPRLTTVQLRAQDLNDRNLIRVLDRADIWDRLDDLVVGITGMSEEQVELLGDRLRERCPTLERFFCHTSFGSYEDFTIPSLDRLGALPAHLKKIHFGARFSSVVEPSQLIEPGCRPISLRAGDILRQKEPDFLRRFFEQLDLQEIETLSLHQSHIGPEPIEMLAKRSMPALRELDLESCLIGSDGFRALLQADWFPQLEVLSLKHNDLQPADLQALAQQANACQLHSLELHNNDDLALPDVAALLEHFVDRIIPLEMGFTTYERETQTHHHPRRPDGSPWPAHIQA